MERQGLLESPATLVRRDLVELIREQVGPVGRAGHQESQELPGPLVEGLPLR